MALAQTLLAELEQEAGITRPFLERLPADKLTWRPHPKSMTLGQLALHVAGIPGGISRMAQGDQVPAPDFTRPNPQPGSCDEVLTAFDRSIATAREMLPRLDDAAMARDWSAMLGDEPMLTLPRAAMLRGLLLNHWYQHRGQLSVYLRLLDVPVPSTYGPSADELPASPEGKLIYNSVLCEPF
ncbi:MAG: DinB family protein [Acidobacteriota bacterium]